jgi:hypothetical protein
MLFLESTAGIYVKVGAPKRPITKRPKLKTTHHETTHAKKRSKLKTAQGTKRPKLITTHGAKRPIVVNFTVVLSTRFQQAI